MRIGKQLHNQRIKDIPKYIVGIKMPFPIEGRELFEFKTKENADEFVEEMEKQCDGIQIIRARTDG